ncbi:MAG: metallophosphoesterase [Acidimicrobiales bacterium]
MVALPPSFEPYVQLVDVTTSSALVAWGGFHLHEDGGRWGAVAHGETIGARSVPHGRAAVEVVDLDGKVIARSITEDANHVWLEGLVPGTAYRYEVTVDGEPWGQGVRRDWSPDGLRPASRPPDQRLATHAEEDRPDPVTFLALGDFGVGIANGEHGQRLLGVARTIQRWADALPVRFIMGLGDTIYHGPGGKLEHTGAVDTDWWLTFFQPYRHLLDHLPFYPTAGNHDGADTEASDDRAQLEDNLFLLERFGRGEDLGRASLSPGLFYRVQVGALLELVCIDTTWGRDRGEHWFCDAEHQRWLRQAFAGQRAVWQVPFCHHPAWGAGPHHPGQVEQVEHLVPLYDRAGVRLLLHGHEHNLQHGQVDGLDYVVSGAGGKLQLDPPTAFDDGGTLSWAAEPHCLLIRVDEDRLTITPYGATPPGGQPAPVVRRTPDGEATDAPIVLPR